MPSYIPSCAVAPWDRMISPTDRTTAKATVTANSGHPKACMRLTRCMSITLRERITELLSAHRRGGRGGGAVDDVVLQGDGGDPETGRTGPLRTARLGMDGRSGEPAELLEVEHVGVADEGPDLLEPPGDLDRRAAQLVGLRGDLDPALVQQHHVLEQAGDLVDVVGGEDHGAGVRREVRQQTVEEQPPGHRVQAQVGLVEEGQRGTRGEPDDDADGGELAARELLDDPLLRQPELGYQLAGELVVPGGVEALRDAQHVQRAEPVGIL